MHSFLLDLSWTSSGGSYDQGRSFLKDNPFPTKYPAGVVVFKSESGYLIDTLPVTIKFGTWWFQSKQYKNVSALKSGKSMDGTETWTPFLQGHTPYYKTCYDHTPFNDHKVLATKSQWKILQKIRATGHEELFRRAIQGKSRLNPVDPSPSPSPSPTSAPPTSAPPKKRLRLTNPPGSDGSPASFFDTDLECVTILDHSFFDTDLESGGQESLPPIKLQVTVRDTAAGDKTIEVYAAPGDWFDIGELERSLKDQVSATLNIPVEQILIVDDSNKFDSKTAHIRQMQVFVKHHTTSYVLVVDPNDKIATVKAMVCAKTMMPLTYQHRMSISFQTQRLDDSSTLADYSVKECSTLNLFFTGPGGTVEGTDDEDEEDDVVPSLPAPKESSPTRDCQRREEKGREEDSFTDSESSTPGSPPESPDDDGVDNQTFQLLADIAALRTMLCENFPLVPLGPKLESQDLGTLEGEEMTLQRLIKAAYAQLAEEESESEDEEERRKSKPVAPPPPPALVPAAALATVDNSCDDTIGPAPAPAPAPVPATHTTTAGKQKSWRFKGLARGLATGLAFLVVVAVVAVCCVFIPGAAEFFAAAMP
jgi:hypothetical protein